MYDIVKQKRYEHEKHIFNIDKNVWNNKILSTMQYMKMLGANCRMPIVRRKGNNHFSKIVYGLIVKPMQLREHVSSYLALRYSTPRKQKIKATMQSKRHPTQLTG